MDSGALPPGHNLSGWKPLSPENWNRHLDLLKLQDQVFYKFLVSQKDILQDISVRYEAGVPVELRVSDGEVIDLVSFERKGQELLAGLASVFADEPGLLIVAGIGYGTELRAVDQLRVRHRKTVVLCLDKDELPIPAALALNDISDLLASGTVVWSCGGPLDESLAEVIHRHCLYLIGDGDIRVFFGSTAQEPQIQESYFDAIRTVAIKMQTWRADSHAAQQRFLEYLPNRSEIPGHVWSSGSPGQYTSTPILKALHRGFQFRGLRQTFTELPGLQSNPYIESTGLVRANPDTILFLNNPTRLHVPEGEFHRIVWITDDPAFRSFRTQAPRFDSQELVLYADPTYEAELAAQGAERRVYLPAFALLEREGEFHDEYHHPLVYVGKINNLNPVLDEISSDDREAFEGAALRVHQAGTGTPGLARYWSDSNYPSSLPASAERICLAAGRSFGDEHLRLTYAAYVLDTFLWRLAFIRALLPLGLHVYGGPEWAELLGADFADRCHGFVPYDHLADIYHSADISLNLHSLQLPTALNIRDYDVLMAGGCLLADPVAGPDNVDLEPGNDYEAAATPEEFTEKAGALLADPGRREALSRAGREKVLTAHLPLHRTERILDEFRI